MESVWQTTGAIDSRIANLGVNNPFGWLCTVMHFNKISHVKAKPSKSPLITPEYQNDDNTTPPSAWSTRIIRSITLTASRFCGVHISFNQKSHSCPLHTSWFSFVLQLLRILCPTKQSNGSHSIRYWFQILSAISTADIVVMKSKGYKSNFNTIHKSWVARGIEL